MSAEISEQGYFSHKQKRWVGPEEQADIKNIYGHKRFGSTIPTENLERSSLNILSLTAEVFGKGSEKLHRAFEVLGRIIPQRSQPELANPT